MQFIDHLCPIGRCRQHRRRAIHVRPVNPLLAIPRKDIVGAGICRTEVTDLAAIIVVVELIWIRDAGLDITIRIGPAIAVIGCILARCRLIRANASAHRFRLVIVCSPAGPPRIGAQLGRVCYPAIVAAIVSPVPERLKLRRHDGERPILRREGIGERRFYTSS